MSRLRINVFTFYFFVVIFRTLNDAATPPTEILASTATKLSDLPPCPRDYPTSLTTEEVEQGLEDSSIVVVDVRRHQELLATGKIPNSHNIPLAEIEGAFLLNDPSFLTRYGFPKPAPHQLVLSCRTGRRTVKAWRLLVRLGYCEARHYGDSFTGWLNQGMTVEKTEPEPEPEF